MGEHILVINGSPRAQRGTTGIVINQFLKGCHELGATSEIIEVATADLKFCAGELACYFRPAHQSCRVHKIDKGSEFTEKWITADRIVLASPLHFNCVTAHLKRFLERLICMSSPYYVENDGYPTHQVPYPPKPSVVIGVCAYPGVANFNLFREVMLNYQKVFWLEGGGNVLVPMSRDLTVLNRTNPRYAALQEVMASIAKAGREFMTHNEISLETEAEISRDTDDLANLHAEFDGYTFLYTKCGRYIDTSETFSLWILPPAPSNSDWMITQHQNFPFRQAMVDARFSFKTPIFDFPAVAAQAELPRLNGQQHSYYCGSHFGFGLHEEAVSSAIQVVEQLGVTFQ